MIEFTLYGYKETEAEKIYCSARILKEEGLILKSQGKTEDSSKSLEISNSSTKATDAVVNKKAGTGTTSESKVDLSADSFFKHLF